jgi:hypothetical protein
MIIPALPFSQDDKKIHLSGPVMLSCGCGNVTARWASVAQNLSARIPQGKPKSSKIIHNWLTQEGLWDKWPELKQHTFGVVVAETENGWEHVNIMDGTTMKVAERVGQLIRRNKECMSASTVAKGQ